MTSSITGKVKATTCDPCKKKSCGCYNQGKKSYYPLNRKDKWQNVGKYVCAAFSIYSFLKAIHSLHTCKNTFLTTFPNHYRGLNKLSFIFYTHCPYDRRPQLGCPNVLLRQHVLKDTFDIGILRYKVKQVDFIINIRTGRDTVTYYT